MGHLGRMIMFLGDNETSFAFNGRFLFLFFWRFLTWVYLSVRVQFRLDDFQKLRYSDSPSSFSFF